MFVKDHRVTETAGLLGKPGDDAHLHPTEFAVKGLGGAPLTGVEVQQGTPGFEGGFFDRAHQGFGDSLAAGFAVDEKLLHLSPVQAVGGRGELEHHRSHHLPALLGGEQDALALGQTGEHPLPEPPGFRPGERGQEAHRGPAVHAVSQHFGQLGEDGAGLLGPQAANGPHALNSGIIGGLCNG
nr:hypothetical protein [Meiothermus sp. PNK-Is4]